MGLEAYKYEEYEEVSSFANQELKNTVSYKSEIENSRENLSQLKIETIDKFLEKQSHVEALGNALTHNKEATLLYNQSFLNSVKEMNTMLSSGQELPPHLKEIGMKAYNSAYPQGAIRPSFEKFINNVADTSNEEKKVLFDFSWRTFKPAV